MLERTEKKTGKLTRIGQTRAVAYVRVSTDRQADEGVSLDAQGAKVRAYAELHELALVDVVIDAGESAKSLNRPGLRKVLGMLEADAADAVLVVKLDRLTRSVRHLGELLERYFSTDRWALLSVSESIDTRSAAGRLVLNVLASVAQWEREAIGERTSAALQHKRASGEYTGGRVPVGFRLADDGVRLVPVPEEQAMVELARNLRAAGLSLRKIGAELLARGYRTRSGQPFAAQQVKRMLAA